MFFRRGTTTRAREGAASLLPDVLEQVEDELSQVTADGAYDSRNCYDLIREREARAAIPPRDGAKIWQHGNTKRERHIRDENLRAIRRKGRREWKRESGYHRPARSFARKFINWCRQR